MFTGNFFLAPSIIFFFRRGFLVRPPPPPPPTMARDDVHNTRRVFVETNVVRRIYIYIIRPFDGDE